MLFHSKIILESIYVPQGNGYGVRIDRHSDSKVLLKTQDLTDCLAILITDNQSCYMIHSDANDRSGKGSISLKDGLKKIGIKSNEIYSIGLVGGQTESASNHKKSIIENLLPNSTVKMVSLGGNGDTAYLLGDGFMTDFKREIKQHLNVDEIEEVIKEEQNRYLKKNY
jgi:hypothetical protein